MPSQVIKDTFLNVYRDDYRDSDNYYKILFNSGRALQQRELNQMQTILNKDINAISSFTFKPGAAVVGASTAWEGKVAFVKLDTSDAQYALPATPTSLEGLIFTENTTGIKVKIEKVIEATATDPATLFISYIDDDGSTSEDSPSLTLGSVLTEDGGSEELKVTSTDTVSNPAFGFGCLYAINPGRIYIDDHFVFTPLQKVVVSKYTSDVDAEVGFLVTEQIITVSDDENLYDNSGPNLNLAAPGADRYKIALTLTLRSNVDSDQYFINIARISRGQVVYELNNNDAIGQRLNEIENYSAQRHRDTHGSFTIKPHTLKIDYRPADNDYFGVLVSSGASFVNGHYVSIQDGRGEYLLVTKPRTTLETQNQNITAYYGNYIEVETGELSGTFNYNTLVELDIYDAVDGGGTARGTLRVRGIQEVGSVYRIYVFDVLMDSGYNFSAMKSISDGTAYANIKLQAGIAKIKNAQENNLLFALSRTRPEFLTDTVLTVQRVVTDTSTGSGTLTISPTAGWEFTDTNQWLVTRNDTGALITPTITNNGTSANITGLPNSTACSFVTYQVSTGNYGKQLNKTLTSTSKSGSLSSGVLTLNHADIYDITSIVDDTTSDDITDEFTLDNGQRDNFYEIGNVTIKPGATQPAGTVTVTYRYFARSGTGAYFSKNSYDGQIAYSDIPTHRQNNGELIQLRDVLDFRPTKTTGGGFTNIFALPQEGSSITSDITWYLGKKATLVASEDGYFSIREGEPALDPKYRDLTGDLLEIARLDINPYMLDANDLDISYVRNKRYTMKDIARIDDELQDLKELTTLSLLEMDTSNLKVLDSDGLDRLKSGLTADNFKDHYQSDIFLDANNYILNPEYNAAIDPVKGELRPKTVTRTIELVYDSDNSSGIIKKGDTLLIDYDEVIWKQNPEASRVINVSDLAISVFQGKATISPSIDNWVEEDPDAQAGTEYKLPNKINPGENRLSVLVGNTHKYFSLNWQGISEEDLQDYRIGKDVATGPSSSSSYTTGGNTSTSHNSFLGRLTTTTSAVVKHTTTKTPVYSYNGYETLNILDQNARASLISIPYMRSRFVSFRFTGLRPNTRHFFFFRGVGVNDYVYSTTGIGGFSRMSDLSRDDPFLEVAQLYRDQVQFPSSIGGVSYGPTAEHMTDANGAISGWFLIPALTFDAGEAEFYIQDISSYANSDNSTSRASATYSAQGRIQQYIEQYKQYRVYNIEQRIAVTSLNEVITPEKVTVTSDGNYFGGTNSGIGWSGADGGYDGLSGGGGYDDGGAGLSASEGMSGPDGGFGGVW